MKDTDLIISGSHLLPSWLALVANEEGSYCILDNSFDGDALQIASFESAHFAMQFAMRLATLRTGQAAHNIKYQGNLNLEDCRA